MIIIYVVFIFSIRTEMDRDGLGGATSHMAIAQASLAHSGIYTCSVSDSISQSLRLHIIDGELPGVQRALLKGGPQVW